MKTFLLFFLIPFYSFANESLLNEYLNEKISAKEVSQKILSNPHKAKEIIQTLRQDTQFHLNSNTPEDPEKKKRTFYQIRALELTLNKEIFDFNEKVEDKKYQLKIRSLAIGTLVALTYVGTKIKILRPIKRDEAYFVEYAARIGVSLFAGTSGASLGYLTGSGLALILSDEEINLEINLLD